MPAHERGVSGQHTHQSSCFVLLELLPWSRFPPPSGILGLEGYSETFPMCRIAIHSNVAPHFRFRERASGKHESVSKKENVACPMLILEI